MSVRPMIFFAACSEPVAFAVHSYDMIPDATHGYRSNELARELVAARDASFRGLEHMSGYRCFGFWRVKGGVA